MNFVHSCFRLSIKWLKRAPNKINKPFCLPCKGRWVQLVGATCCTRRDCEKAAWTSSPSCFWRFLSFARGQYHCTAPTRKIQNLSHFLKIYQRVEIYIFYFFYTLTGANFVHSCFFVFD